MLRRGLRSCLENQSDWQVAAEATNGAGAEFLSVPVSPEMRTVESVVAKVLTWSIKTFRQALTPKNANANWVRKFCPGHSP
jgi:hypothetical protein